MNSKIVRAIDAFLDANNKQVTSPPEVAPYLEKIGVLRNSKARSGKELRVLLRNGQIPNAHQNGSKWVIQRSNFKAIRKVETIESKSTNSTHPTTKLNEIQVPESAPTSDKLSWDWCQDNSDSILLSGLSILTSSYPCTFDHHFPFDFGNYLISDINENWIYIGESNNLFKRLSQQANPKISTFFKNYEKVKIDHPTLPQDLDLNDFQVKHILCNLGRKELEEFGIVNNPCNLNKFQLGKREHLEGNAISNIWDNIQRHASIILEEGFQAISQIDFVPWNKASPKEKAGIYWIEHPEDGLIYIGESSNIAERYKAHSKTTYFSAFRRNAAENKLGFTLKKKKNKKRYLSPGEELFLDEYISQCLIKTLPVTFGRFELEQYLITLKQPTLNRKGKSK